MVFEFPHVTFTSITLERLERYCYCPYFREREMEAWRIDYVGLVELVFDHSLTFAEERFFLLRHQRK